MQINKSDDCSHVCEEVPIPLKEDLLAHIYGRVLKELSTDISSIITFIFEKPRNTGKIPSDRKHANVCPVLKNGDKPYQLQAYIPNMYPM